MKEKVTPCLHGITMLRWEKGWYWCDRSRVPQFSWMQHNTACMWQWRQNHTENSGPSAREPQRQWSQLLGCISDHPYIFNTVHKSYTPTLSPGSRSDENATLEYAKKNANFVQILEKRNMLSFFGWQKFECAVKTQRGTAVWTNWHGSVDNSRLPCLNWRTSSVT